MKLLFIRHGQVPLNMKKCYVGRTDECLSEEGRKALVAKMGRGVYPRWDTVFVSPMKRCIETAEFIFPSAKLHIIEDLREMDFGVFEGKNYMELKDNEHYQAWLASDCTLPILHGESRAEFAHRCVTGFTKGIRYCREEAIEEAAFVVHGGTIMSIMERYEEHRQYYEWICDNGCGYLADFDGERLKVMGRIGEEQ